MTRADILRRRARDCELRARALADRAAVDDSAEKAADAEAVAARVLLELALVEEEVEAA